MIFKIFDVTGVLPKGTKDKIEGIIIGLNLRENLECSNPNQSYCITYNINRKGGAVSGTNKKSQSSYDS